MGIVDKAKQFLEIDKLVDEPKSHDDVSVEFESKSSILSSRVVRWGVPVAAVGVLLGTMSVTSGIKSNRSSTLSSQQNQITTLKNQIDVAKVSRQNAADKVNSQISGISSERESGDDAAIQGLMSSVTTWSSYDDYMSARQSIMRKYKLSESSPFMTSFMPKIKSIKDKNGTSYNQIDTNGLNMKMTGFNSSVTKVAGTKYTYIGVASVQTTNSSTNGSTKTYTFIEYTTNPKHELSNLKAYPVGSNPSTAGTLSNVYG